MAWCMPEIAELFACIISGPLMLACNLFCCLHEVLEMGFSWLLAEHCLENLLFICVKLPNPFSSKGLLMGIPLQLFLML